MKSYYRLIALLVFSLFTISCASNLPPKVVGNPDAPGVKPYPLDTCLVIDRKLKATRRTYVRVHENQEVKFCCKECVKAFEYNPEPWMEKLKRLGH